MSEHCSVCGGPVTAYCAIQRCPSRYRNVRVKIVGSVSSPEIEMALDNSFTLIQPKENDNAV